MFKYDSTFRLLRLYGPAAVRGFTARRALNALRTEWAYRRRQIDVRSKPYILFIEPLYYCNLKCPLCPRQTPDFKGQKGKLELDLITQVFDELGPYLFQCSIFGNGEPTLDWDKTQQVIDAARKHRIFTMVSTNATLITPALAERIVTSGLDYLVCAIDGVSQEAYETYRVGGTVEGAMNGMRHVLAAKQRSKSKMIVEWQYLVHRRNEHELEAARALATQLGVAIRFAPIGGMGKDEAVQEQWAAQDPNFRKHVEHGDAPTNRHHCYWLWRGMYINATGTLARCPGFAGASMLGDLRRESISAVYNGPITQSQRRIFNQAAMPADARVPAPCDTCTLYVRCHAPAKTVPTRALISLDVASR